MGESYVEDTSLGYHAGHHVTHFTDPNETRCWLSILGTSSFGQRELPDTGIGFASCSRDSKSSLMLLASTVA